MSTPNVNGTVVVMPNKYDNRVDLWENLLKIDNKSYQISSTTTGLTATFMDVKAYKNHTVVFISLI